MVGLLWEREHHRDSQKEGPGAVWKHSGVARFGEETTVPQEGGRGNVKPLRGRRLHAANLHALPHIGADGEHPIGKKARIPFTEGQPDLQTHERVGEAHVCSGDGFSRSMKNRESSFFDHSVEFGKDAHYQEGANRAGEKCRASL
jgi:hypothetical protein